MSRNYEMCEKESLAVDCLGFWVGDVAEVQR